MFDFFRRVESGSDIVSLGFDLIGYIGCGPSIHIQYRGGNIDHGLISELNNSIRSLNGVLTISLLSGGESLEWIEGFDVIHHLWLVEVDADRYLSLFNRGVNFLVLSVDEAVGDGGFDVSSLGGATNLQGLHISGRKIKNSSCISEIGSLKRLSVQESALNQNFDMKRLNLLESLRVGRVKFNSSLVFPDSLKYVEFWRCCFPVSLSFGLSCRSLSYIVFEESNGMVDFPECSGNDLVDVLISDMDSLKYLTGLSVASSLATFRVHGAKNLAVEDVVDLLKKVRVKEASIGFGRSLKENEILAKTLLETLNVKKPGSVFERQYPQSEGFLASLCYEAR